MHRRINWKDERYWRPSLLQNRAHARARALHGVSETNLKNRNRRVKTETLGDCTKQRAGDTRTMSPFPFRDMLGIVRFIRGEGQTRIQSSPSFKFFQTAKISNLRMIRLKNYHTAPSTQHSTVVYTDGIYVHTVIYVNTWVTQMPILCSWRGLRFRSFRDTASNSRRAPNAKKYEWPDSPIMIISKKTRSTLERQRFSFGVLDRCTIIRSTLQSFRRFKDENKTLT